MLTTEKDYSEINYTKRFIVYTYGLFWIMLVIFGGIFALTGQNPLIMKYGSWVCSWAPTISLLILFKKLFPGITIKDFYKKAFSQKISKPLVLTIAVIYILLITAITYTVSIYCKVPFTSMWDLSASTLLSGIFTTAISGPMGEESGWRGFLLPVMWKKTGVIKGAILLSTVWAPWHAPLWFIPGYTGIKLLEYIALFIIGNVCLSLVISICYDYNRNLFIPIWIHFMSNVIETPYRGDFFVGRVWDVLFYSIIALGFILWYKIRVSRK